MADLRRISTEIKLLFGIGRDLYYTKNETRIVYEGETRGRRYFVKSIKGIAPTVYIQAKKDWRGERCGKGGCPAHGGFTWYGQLTDEYFKPISEECYLGWDFMHEGDYMHTEKLDGEVRSGKIWTLRKIKKNVEEVAEWLDAKENGNE